jgi:MSHA biogenesis protein MshN
VGLSVIILILIVAVYLLLPKHLMDEPSAPALIAVDDSALLAPNPAVASTEQEVASTEKVASDLTAEPIADAVTASVSIDDLEEETLASLSKPAAPTEQVPPTQQAPQSSPTLDQPLISQVASVQDKRPEPTSAPATAKVEPVFSVSSSRDNSSTGSANRMLEQRIQLSLKNGDTPSAIKYLHELLQLEPRNISARKRLASLSFAQNDATRATILLHQGIKLSPEDSSMRLMLARLLFRENQPEQAFVLLNEHPPTVLADNELLSFRAALAEKLGDYKRSYTDYRALLKRQPNNARWMLGLAISQDKQQLHTEAVATYKQVKSSNQLSTQVVSFVDGRLAALVGS